MAESAVLEAEWLRTSGTEEVFELTDSGLKGEPRGHRGVEWEGGGDGLI